MNTYAIIEAGGEQLHVEPGRFYDIRQLTSYGANSWKTNTRVLFSRVLLIRHQSTVLLGNPWLENATIRGHILHLRRADKVISYKMRPKKKTRVKRGHRQSMARLAIDAICLHGNVLHSA